MDFIVGLPLMSKKHDSIWIIVDRLIKSAHFIPVHTTYNTKKYAELYTSKVLCLHGVPKTIISDRGPQFVSHFFGEIAFLPRHYSHQTSNRWTNRKVKSIYGR